MTTIAWVHDDALRHCFGDTPAIYVFDDKKLVAEQWSLKRIGFIYECLLQLPVEIRRGDPVEQVAAFQRRHHAEKVLTMVTPDPGLREQIQALNAEMQYPPAFVEIGGKVDLKRFSRYWTKAERYLNTLAATLE